MEDMHTLQEFATFTKGFCYVLAGVVLLVFIPFWLYLVDRDKKD